MKPEGVTLAAVAGTSRVETTHIRHARALEAVHDLGVKLERAFSELDDAAGEMEQAGAVVTHRLSPALSAARDAWAAGRKEQERAA
jgi:hypothetical protein